MVNVAIIGCGNIAKEKHIPNLLKLDNAKIVALFDINLQRAASVKKEFSIRNCHIYDDYSELLKNKDVDAVHICTPNAFHAPMSIQALKSGKHVLCEKPMAMNTEEAEEMVRVSKETGRHLSISMQNRFRKDSLYLKKLIENGDLGDIYLSKALAVRSRAIPCWGDFLNKEKQGGGALIDIGVHALDLTLWLIDNFKPKYVVGKTYREIAKQKGIFNSLGEVDAENMDVEESGFGYVMMENGASVFIESSWALNVVEAGEAKTLICGSKGGADMKDGLRINGEKYNQRFITKPLLQKEELEYYNDEFDNEKYVEIKMWIDALENGTQPTVKAEELLVVTKIIDALYKSSETNDIVYL